MKIYNVDRVFKDLYPLPGARIKQWVVDLRNQHRWENETCPVIEMSPHDDNTGAPCISGAMSTTWLHAKEHAHCAVCNDAAAAIETRPDVSAWRTERDKRPPICSDRDRLSDEVQADHAYPSHPFLDLVARR